MHEWIRELGPSGRVLDLGAGAGSLKAFPHSCMVVTVDCDPSAFQSAFEHGGVVAFGQSLPFRNAVFDLVICHHVLEHVAELDGTLAEIRRVLKPSGKMYVSVPNGFGLCDGIYRWLFEGGDHVNRFRKEELKAKIEGAVGLRLARWQKLYSSFAYLYRIRYLNPAIVPDLPRRLRVAARLPSRLRLLVQAALYIGTRMADRFAGVDWALYGWSLYFDCNGGIITENRPFVNVCLNCGSGHAARDLARYRRVFYDCPTCGHKGIFVPPFRNGR